MSSLNTAIVPVEDVVVTPKGVNPKSRTGRSISAWKEKYLSPQTNPTASTYQSSNAQAIFKLTDTTLDNIESFSLQFQFQNNDANPYTFTSSQFFIDHFEVRVNGNVMETIYNWQLWQKRLIHLNNNNFCQYAKSENFSATLTSANGLVIANGPTVASGALATYYLEFDTILNRAGVNWRLLSERNTIELYVYFSDQTRITYVPLTTQVVPSLTGIRLYQKGYELQYTERSALQAAINNKGWSSLGLVYANLTVPVGTLVANILSPTFLMSGINGTMQRISLNIIRQNIQPVGGVAQMTGYQDFIDTTLINSDGSPYDISNIPQTLKNMDNYAFGDPSAVNTSQPLFMYYMAPDVPKGEGSKGALKGGVKISDWRFQFTSAATVPGVAQIAQIHFLQLCSIIITKSFGIRIDRF